MLRIGASSGKRLPASLKDGFFKAVTRQWYLKVSAAGIAVLLQGAIPSGAFAENSAPSLGTLSPQFTLAATTSPSAFKGLKYPALFGSQEIMSNDITPFKKWSEVTQRFEAQMKTTAADAPRVALWKAEIERLRDKPQSEQITGINAFLNKVPYVEDMANYGQRDYWATPVEFLTRGGDCEDFAIAKYASLRALGFSAQQLRIAIVQDKVKNIPHALLIVYSDSGNFVLDNQDKQVEPITLVTRYKPIFSINSTNWWLHRA